jgi:hypothetical protein
VFVLKNFGDAPLALTGHISSYNPGGDWEILKDKMQVMSCVVASTTDPVQKCPSVDGHTGWQTLAEALSPIAVQGGPLLPGTERILLVNFMLPADADNTYAGKSVTGMQITIDGETL